MSTLSGAVVYQSALKAGFSPTDAVVATQIAWAESGWNPNATHKNSNGSTDYGLMQINDRANADVLTNGSWSDPVANMRMAKVVKDRQGWAGAWKATYKGKKYNEVKVAGNPFSAGSQDVSFSVKGQPTSFGVTGSTTGPVTLGSLPNPLAPVTDFLGKLTNPGLWTRVGIGGLGTLLVVLGILFLFWQAKDKVVSGAVGSVVKGATK